jgi:urea transport system substrate-binding protein
LCIAETEIDTIGIENMIGDYAAWGYFQTIPWQVNKIFVAALKEKYGKNQLASDATESAYFAVYLWKNSVIAAQTIDPKQVRKHLSLQPFYAPEGMIYSDQSNNNTWRFSRIGKVQKDGQFFIIWESEKAINPQPFSLYFNEADLQSINVQLSKDIQ